MEINFRTLPRFADHSYRITLLISEWARAYGVPESAIIRQLAYAHGWIASNPRKAPKKDPVRFLFNWMRKAKQYGNLRAPEGSKMKTPVQEEAIEESDLLDIHRQTVKALGRCRIAHCEKCAEIAKRNAEMNVS